MGKITVVKPFALPQLVYPFTVLENRAVETLDEIKKVSLFIWNGKPHNVKISMLVNEYKDCGMKLTHVNMFLNSLKCGWVKRI